MVEWRSVSNNLCEVSFCCGIQKSITYPATSATQFGSESKWTVTYHGCDWLNDVYDENLLGLWTDLLCMINTLVSLCNVPPVAHFVLVT